VLAVSSRGELAVMLKKTRLFRPGGFGTLARVPLGGGTPREVLEEVSEADWSPDGEELAVIRRAPDGKQEIEYPLGTVLYKGGDLAELRVSPRGDLVAFEEWEPGHTHGTIVTIDRKGKQTILSRNWSSIKGLVWAPGGSLVVAGARSHIDYAILEISATGKEHLLLGNALGLTLHDAAPDGRLLVERAAQRTGLRCLVRGEGRERELGWLDLSVVQSLAPDGSAVLFGEYGEARDPKGGVYLRKTDGSPAVRLGDGQGMDLSADGHWALSINPGPPRSLVLLPTGAGSPQKIPIEDFEPFFAFFLPGGKGYGLVAPGKDEPVSLRVVGREGGKPRRVQAENTGWDASGAVSPDGESIIYVAKTGELRIVPVSGGAGRVVPGPPLQHGDYPNEWSADGRYLYVVKSGYVPSQVDRVELSTGKRELWKRLGPEDLTGVIVVTDIRVARDGQSYAYTYGRVVASDLYVLEGLR
jgi:hypothetical protein